MGTVPDAFTLGMAVGIFGVWYIVMWFLAFHMGLSEPIDLKQIENARSDIKQPNTVLNYK